MGLHKGRETCHQKCCNFDTEHILRAWILSERVAKGQKASYQKKNKIKANADDSCVENRN